MGSFTKILTAAALSAAILTSCTGSNDPYSHLYQDLPFAMERVQLPEIPGNTVTLTDFGAVGDGITLNSAAFSSAIDHLSSMGGGHLIVPEGIWLTGPITLKDHIDLHVTENAVIVFSTDRSLYPIVETVFEGLDTKRCLSPINADGAHDISITGKGVIDGCGESWRQVKRSKMTTSQWNKLLASGGFTNEKGDLWYPDSTSWRGSKVSDSFNVPQGLTTEEEWESVKTYLRPVMVGIKNSSRVLLQGVTFQNSPCWNIHPLMCDNVILDGLSVRNPWYSQNGDGLDLDSCENVLIVNSTFDVGDDAICIKSGKDEDGRRRARPTRNVIVDNCTVYHGHGGFVVGSEMSGGVANISVTNCRFLGTDVGLRFKSCRGRGGVVENIWANNIYMKDIPTEPLLFDLHYGGKSAIEAAEDGDPAFDIAYVPADETTPEFRDIHISNIVCSGAARAMYFNGIPEKNITNITVTDCVITSTSGAELRYSDGVVLKDVDIRQSEGQGWFFANCKDVKVSGCSSSEGPAGTESTFNYKSEVSYSE